MKRNVFLIRALVGILVVMMVPFGAFSQDAAPTGAFSQQDLDQMLAPIALYPDSLLAQVLIAATYPDQVTEADRWLKANPGINGDALNNALDGMNWDLSVKALAPFPAVLDMMAKESAWTQRLGEAFLAQQDAVMDSVQKLRQKAQAAGNLKTTAEQKVVVQGENIEIEPANPQVVYVPQYNPAVIYGPWWWPAYPPYAYYPVWPGVVVGGLVGLGFFGAVAVGPVWGFGWGSWGWGSHNVNINVNRNININRNLNINRNSVHTTNFHQAAAAGRIGSSQTRAAAMGRTGAGRTGAGRTGATGGAAGGGRPSAASVQHGLSGGGAKGGAGAGGSRATGNATRGAGGAGGGRATGNVSRGGGAGAGGAGGSRATGNVSRGGGAGAAGGSRATGNATRGAGAGGRSAGSAGRGGGAGGGGKGGGAPRGGGGGGKGGGGGGKKK